MTIPRAGAEVGETVPGRSGDGPAVSLAPSTGASVALTPFPVGVVNDGAAIGGYIGTVLMGELGKPGAPVFPPVAPPAPPPGATGAAGVPPYMGLAGPVAGA